MDISSNISSRSSITLGETSIGNFQSPARPKAEEKFSSPYAKETVLSYEADPMKSNSSIFAGSLLNIVL